jgi:hypothetical protein
VLQGALRAEVDGALALDEPSASAYFDGSSGFAEGAYASAFAQAWNIERTLTAGQVSLCRWHVLGTELDFAASLELGFTPANPSLVDEVQTTAFLYQ